MIFLGIFKEFLNLEKAVENNDVAGILLIIIFVLSATIIYLFNIYVKNNKKHKKDLKDLQDHYTKKREESEKELMDVLNGVSTILKMSEQADKYQTEKILTAIKTLGERIMDKLENIKN